MGWFSDFFSDPFSTVVDTVTDNVVPVITAGAQLATGNVGGAALTVGSTIAKNTGGGDTLPPPPPLAKSSQDLGIVSTPLTPSPSGVITPIESQTKLSPPVMYTQPQRPFNYRPIIFGCIVFILMSRIK